MIEFTFIQVPLAESEGMEMFRKQPGSLLSVGRGSGGEHELTMLCYGTTSHVSVAPWIHDELYMELIISLQNVLRCWREALLEAGFSFYVLKNPIFHFSNLFSSEPLLDHKVGIKPRHSQREKYKPIIHIVTF